MLKAFSKIIRKRWQLHENNKATEYAKFEWKNFKKLIYEYIQQKMLKNANRFKHYIKLVEAK